MTDRTRGSTAPRGGDGLFTGTFATMTGGQDVQGVLVADGRVVDLGDSSFVAHHVREGATAVELDPGLVVPGFVDAHTHLGHVAAGRVGTVDCRAPRVAGIEDLLDVLTEAVRAEPGTSSIVGFGNLFYDKKLRDGRLPTRHELDMVSVDRPVIVRCGGHTSVLNSKALESLTLADVGSAGLTGRGIIERDHDGAPTGQVSELDGHLPMPLVDEDALAASYERLIHEEFTALGVTTICEMVDNLDHYAVLRRLVTDRRIGSAVHGYVMTPQAADFERAIDLTTGAGSNGLLGVKVFLDGGFSARNAAVLAPYTDLPGSRTGELSLSAHQLAAIMRRTEEAGVGLAVHVNGEAAQQEALSARQAVGGGVPVRLEHAGNYVTDRDLSRALADEGFVCVINPAFFSSYIGDFFPDILGPGVLGGRMPVAFLRDLGHALGAGSDVGIGAEIDQTDPLGTVRALVTRRTRTGAMADPEQAIDVLAALKLVTADSAKALGVDDEVGTIEVGKRADFAVLSHDPRGRDTASVEDLCVTSVVVGGRLVPEARP